MQNFNLQLYLLCCVAKDHCLLLVTQHWRHYFNLGAYF